MPRFPRPSPGASEKPAFGIQYLHTGGDDCLFQLIWKQRRTVEAGEWHNSDRSDPQGQLAQTTQPHVVPPDEMVGPQHDLPCAPQQGGKGDVALKARQRRAEAKMCSGTEREVLIIRARDIEAVGLGKALRIAVCRSHNSDHRLPATDWLAS